MDVDRTAWASTLVKNNDENKTYILVKLSESFSHAIQEYSAPTIKFHGTRGAIRFQNGKTYDFSLEQSVIPVECIKQTKNRWESVGKIARCLHVKGKDDVYQRTKTKMEAAEQEKRKNCAKLLGTPEHQQEQLHQQSQPTTKHQTQPQYQSHNHHHNHNNNNHSGSSSNSTTLATSINNTTTTNTTTTDNININNNGNSNINNNNNNNYLINRDYPDITDDEQRDRYKTEFHKDFIEYHQLHGYLHRIELRFRKLNESFANSAEFSPEWELAKEGIYNEYERFRGDSNFHKKRARYKRLYKKLAHIKTKLMKYNRDKGNLRKKRKR